MTHRERFILAATRQEPDRVPFDLCGSTQSLIDYQVTRDRLNELYGLTGEKQGNYCIDERIMIALDTDTRLVGGEATPKTSHQRTENGITYDRWGIGSREVNGHMEICHNPLRDCDIDTIMTYEFPNPEKIDRKLLDQWTQHAKFLHENTDYAVVLAHPVFGVFELGCWMFGFDDYLYRLVDEPELIHAFSQRVLDYQKKVSEIYYGALGRYIDCTMSGDDFGTQIGSLISTAMFDDMVKPYLKERITYTKKFTDGFYKQHTCGSVYNLIPSLIDCGVDILNPIQPGTYMMEPERLKADFGDKISFWGGIDIQRLLPKGSVSEVKAEVQRIISILGQGGGFILSPAHSIQDDVPAENVIALYEGAREYYE